MSELVWNGLRHSCVIGYIKILSITCTVLVLSTCSNDVQKPIRIGVLHSISGSDAIDEKHSIDAILMALEEINSNGGLLGRKIEPVQFDGKSDSQFFAQGAEYLINSANVSVVFGGGSSADRKVLKPIFELNNHLLFYSANNEGLEESANIIYTGASPNQFITPAVKWSIEHLGKRVFVTGSNTVYSRGLSELIRTQITALGGEVVGEYYLPKHSNNVDGLIRTISDSNANLILSSINGPTNRAFFEELDVKNNSAPVLSFNLTETDLALWNIDSVEGHYAASSYFQSLPTSENKRFIENIKNFNNESISNATMESSYLSVYLWANTVARAGTLEPDTIKYEVKQEYFSAPSTEVRISATNNHLWRDSHIGRVTNDRQFEIIWSSDSIIRPRPYPSFGNKQYWQRYLDELYQNWGETWQAPEGTVDINIVSDSAGLLK